MRIGIDFDNTLAIYDSLFLRLARRYSLVPKDFFGSKREIRDLVRLGRGGEEHWMALQSEAYGSEISGADLAPGAASFLTQCRVANHDVFIVSHKTRTAAAAPGGVDLRQAALGWMDAKGFFSTLSIGRNRVFFEDTRAAKCKRIGVLKCDVFVDDLVEVFVDPEFPPATDRILLQSSGVPSTGPWRVFGSWPEIEGAIFGV